MNNDIKRDLFICRGCLGSGHMYNIHENRLADLYSLLVGECVSVCDNLPQQLCHMCKAILVKFAAFRRMCQESRGILLGATKDKIMTSEDITKMYKLNKPSYITTTTDLTQYPESEIKIAEVLIKSTHVYEEPKIKLEKVSSPESVRSDSSNECIDTTEPESIITSDITSNVISNITSNVNSDMNSKKKDNGMRKRKAVKREVINKTDKVYKRAQRLDRIKGKYFETKENMSTFESLYDVEVVILSKEQQMKDVLERKLSYNYQNGPFKCDDCYKGFIDEDSFMKHYKAQHDPSRGNIVCEFCRFRYKDKRGLNQHLKSHRLKFVCRQCKYVSRTTFNAKEHFKMHGGQMHECEKCGKSYEKLSTYLTHMRIHHPEELVWCELCGEPFIGEFGLNGHKKRAHRDLKFPAECACARCGTRFTNANAYESHAHAHAHSLASRDASCSELSACAHCGRGFDSPLGLRDHLLETHKTDKKYYECFKCNKTFARESLYSAHFRRMHVEATKRRYSSQPWICEVCGKTLPNKCRLMYHQRNHTGEKPYQCPDCPKSFTMRKLLRSHTRVHSSERPYACKYCPKTFKGPSALKGHENVHTGGRTKTSR